MNGVKRTNENGGEPVNWQQGLQKGGANVLSQIKMKMERLIENRKKERPKGKHLALEGSLGKISLNSVKHPRQMLSVMTKDIMKEREHVDYGPSKTLSRKAILLRVEKVYSLVLALEQLDREGPMEDLEEWAQQVESKKIALWEELRIAENSGYGVIHPFIAFISVSKGKKIISRIIRYLTAEQILGMVVVIFSRMEFLDVCSETPDKNEMNLFLQNIVPSIVGFISELPLPVINNLTQTILQNHEVRWVCTKKIGLIILTLLLSRAEILKQSIPTGQPAIEKDLMVWNELYGYLFSRLYGGFAELFTNFESKFTDGVGIEDDEVYVWQFLSAVAVGAATMEQQRILVIEMRDRIIEKSKVEKSLAHVNLFLSALGLGIDATQLAGVE
ncbi:Protein PAT1 1 [Nowakowskiella sp. JEL0407]|nr:Protein PAT1 1 [Nowakowskiella sp. JEL0407]